MVSHRIASFMALVAFAVVAAGCAEDEVRGKSVADLGCPASHVHVYRGQGGTYVARGCGKWVQYECIYTRSGGNCFPHPEPVVHVVPETRPD